MQVLENIWTFQTENFAVTVDALPEDSSPEGMFDDDGESERAIDCGRPAHARRLNLPFLRLSGTLGRSGGRFARF